jgi:riboflavin-specific deaminase-like protein
MRLPGVEANFALTIDGKISTRQRSPSGFTSARDKRRLLEIRAVGDALLVGRRTLETDNMGMGLAAKDLQEQRLRQGRTAEPVRVIFSSSGRLRADLKVLRTPGAPIVVFTSAAMPAAVRARLERVADVRCLRGCGSAGLRAALQVLAADYNVKVAVCEGGSSLFAGFVRAGVVSRIHITWAPVLFGGATAPTLLGPAASSLLPRSLPLRLEAFFSAGGEGYATYVMGGRGLRPPRR